MSKLRHLLRQKIITQAPSIIPHDGHQQRSLLGTHASSGGNSMNTTRPTPSGTASSVAITRSDNIANDCRHEEGHNRDKTQVWLLERQWISKYDRKFYFSSVYHFVMMNQEKNRRKTRSDVCVKLQISFDPFKHFRLLFIFFSSWI